MSSGPVIACFGAAHWDVIARPSTALAPLSSAPGVIYESPGGVAANVAARLARLGARPALVSALGEDAAGDLLDGRLMAKGVDVAHVARMSGATARYLAIEDETGALVAAIADMALYERLTPERLAGPMRALEGARLWFAEANLEPESLMALARAPRRPPLALDAVSTVKAPRLTGALPFTDLVFCNRAEAEVLAGRPLPHARAALAALMAMGARGGVVTDGGGAAVISHQGETAEMIPPPVRIASVHGAGDALIAGTICALAMGGRAETALAAGLASAARALQAQGAQE